MQPSTERFKSSLRGIGLLDVWWHTTGIGRDAQAEQLPASIYNLHAQAASRKKKSKLYLANILADLAS